MKYVLLLTAAIMLAALVAQYFRWQDNQEAKRIEAELASACLGGCALFEPETLSDQPEPVQRFFNYAIRPGTPLRTVVLLEMTGQIGLGDKQQPNYMHMGATQTLAPPEGLVWNLQAGNWPMQITGSDGAFGKQSWTRFWLAGIVPVVRTTGDHHALSSFGRVVAEAAFWSPASLLPGPNVSWEALDNNRIRATVRHLEWEQIVTLEIDPNGQPHAVVIPRWTNANDDNQFRMQPFGGYLSDFKNVSGFMLPMQVEGGNHFGTEDYFPFYKVHVTRAEFPGISE